MSRFFSLLVHNKNQNFQSYPHCSSFLLTVDYFLAKFLLEWRKIFLRKYSFCRKWLPLWIWLGINYVRHGSVKGVMYDMMTMISWSFGYQRFITMSESWNICKRQMRNEQKWQFSLIRKTYVYQFATNRNCLTCQTNNIKIASSWTS